MIIRVKPGSTIIELTEGNIMPRMARLQSSIVVEAIILHDDKDNYTVYWFKYHDISWTAGQEDVEELTS